MSLSDGILQLPADPVAAFQTWFDEAVRAKCIEPTAMTLATATPDGIPDARIVLFKGMSGDGFAFFTNYNSRKARELEQNPRATLVFLWLANEFRRQVRIEGKVERVPSEESDAYFQSRPRGSQIGAWASPQSQPIPNRDYLIDEVKKYEERFGTGPIARPEFWGGYRVTPTRIEFWEERASRLHERIVFEKSAGAWRQIRLAP